MPLSNKIKPETRNSLFQAVRNIIFQNEENDDFITLFVDDFITLFVVYYFDKQTGALHLIQWAKYSSHFFVLFDSFRGKK